MNVFALLLALALPGEATNVALPVLVAQESVTDEHAHGPADEAHDHSHEHFEDFEARPRRQSYLVWTYQSLGIRYTLLFFLTGPLVFLGSLLVVAMCKRPGPIAAFFPFVAIPALIGVLGFFDGAIASFSVIASSAVAPKPAVIAVGISTALVTPLVGLLIAAPSYLILSIGLFVRTLLYRGPMADPYAKA